MMDSEVGNFVIAWLCFVAFSCIMVTWIANRWE